MAGTVELHATRCAICNTEGNAVELYPTNLDLEAFNPSVFSARRLPDRIHYRMVKCNQCGLVRSDPVADSEVLAQLYQQSTFDYGDEVANLKLTYGRYLAKLDSHGAHKGMLLEVGCGNGFFLEEALRQGYESVRGVEPSTEAVAKAGPSVRSHITCSIMHPGLFEPNQFDVICLFQVFDHISDPDALLDECFRLLKAGGLILGLNHNIEAVSARLMGERSPIIDVEHMYLYSPTTMAGIFQSSGFRVMQVGSVFNNYTCRYLARLVPLPGLLKRFVLALFGKTALGRIQVKLPLGNLYIVAQKP
jgi:SAM-dependent methyltransferase